VDEHAEGILAQPFSVVWGIEDDGKDGGPSLGRCEARVLVAALDPGDPEAVIGGPLEMSTPTWILPTLANGSLVRA